MPEDKDFGRYLERRAEQLGLPTDPEAYQDGGLAVAATFLNLGEAEMSVALLRGEDIPAWANSPLSALAAAMPVTQYGVLVPLGRLADAQKLLAEHEGRAPAPEEVKEPPAKSDSETEEPPEVAPETERRQRGRPLRRTMAGIFFLTFGFGYLAMAVVWAVIPEHKSVTENVISVLAAALLGVGCCAIGMLALRRPR